MEPSRQLIRFSIPGAIFVLSAVGTYAFGKFMLGTRFGDVESLTTLTTSITAIAASLPFGFLFYQFYHWRYGPHIFGGLVTRDRGRDALAGLSDDTLARLRKLFNARLDVRRHHRVVSFPVVRKLKLLRVNKEKLRARYKDIRLGNDEDKLLFEKDNRSIRRIYTDNWYENWDVFRALLDLAATKGERPEIRQTFTSLYDIYHSLGASRLAVVAGPFAAVLYLVGFNQGTIDAHHGRSIGALVAIVAVSLLTAYILHRTRIATWKSTISRVRLDLASCLQPGSPLNKALPQVRPGNELVPRRALRRPSNQHSRPEEDGRMRRLGGPLDLLLRGIGSRQWAGETNGILSRAERVRFCLAVLIVTVREAPGVVYGRFVRRGAGPDPSDVEIPGDDLAKRVIAACGDLTGTELQHAYRSYIFARTLGEVESIDFGAECDESALFAATMLHAVALRRMEGPDAGGEDECFAVASARSAREILEATSMAKQLQDEVCDAISLQLNPVVRPARGTLQHLTHDGILLDTTGVRAWELDREGLKRVLEEHPRHGLTKVGRRVLRAHGRRVRNSRTHVLFHVGFGAAMRGSRWRWTELGEWWQEKRRRWLWQGRPAPADPGRPARSR